MDGLVHLLQSNLLLFVACSGILGLIVGSFLNVVIYRLPIMMEREWRAQCAELNGTATESATTFNLLAPRSQCPHCGHKITALENIPLLSWLALRGRCAACKKPIARRYPLIEAATGILSAIVAGHFGFSAAAAAALLLTWALIALSMIDYDTQLLPDWITLPFLWIGLLLSLYSVFVDPRASIVGAAAGYMSLWSVYIVFKLVTKKEGMGYGDFKLLAMLGAWLGWQMLPVIILLSSAVGAVVGIALILLRGQDRNKPIPFGPYLAAAGWLALLWGQDITQAYLKFSGIAP